MAVVQPYGRDMTAAAGLANPEVVTVWRVHFAGVVASLAWAPAAAGAPPGRLDSSIRIVRSGTAFVTLSAAGDPATYRWNFGDGSGAPKGRRSRTSTSGQAGRRQP